MSRPNLDEIIERSQREQTAEDKAASTPGELTDEDVKSLSPSTVHRLVNSAGLPQLGITAPRKRARR